MKTSKKLLAILPALALVAASCGGSDDNSSEGSTDTAASVDSAAPAATDAPEEVDQTQGGDLTFHMITHSDDGPF